MSTRNAQAAEKSSPSWSRLLAPAAKLWRKLGARNRRAQLVRFHQCCASIPALVGEPFFVKVGAHDGLTGDPCSEILMADPRWKGLLIEPVPYLFERLRTQFGDSRRFILENLAVGSSAGETSFYYVHPQARDSIPNLPVWFDQLGSFSRGHIVKHLDGLLEPFIVESNLAVRPLSAILRSHDVQELHLLQIDTEGHDDEVLKTLDFAEHRPVMIFMEHKHLSDVRRSEVRNLLRSHDYQVRDCGGDYFALDNQANERLQLTARTGALGSRK